jgi:hypothetical protein
MSYQTFYGVKQVAVMPYDAAPADEVLEIADVKHVGLVFVQLEDGRTFATIGGAGLLYTSGCIVVATDEHRAALHARKHKAG